MATLKTYVTDIELDHSSPIPLYHQISEPIKELILDGTIPPGSIAPHCPARPAIAS